MGSLLCLKSLCLHHSSQLAWQQDGLKECVGFAENVWFVSFIYPFPALLSVKCYKSKSSWDSSPLACLIWSSLAVYTSNHFLLLFCPQVLVPRDSLWAAWGWCPACREGLSSLALLLESQLEPAVHWPEWNCVLTGLLPTLSNCCAVGTRCGSVEVLKMVILKASGPFQEA